MSKRIIMMVGIPGIGKSTQIRQITSFLAGRKGNSFKIVSRDEIRFSLVAEDEPYFSKEAQVFKTFIREINKAIKEVDCTFIDATHISKKSRAKVLSALNVPKGCYIEAIVFPNDLEIALAQNSHRQGRERVPDDVVKNMSTNFEYPSCDEGFDTVMPVEVSYVL